MAGTTEIRQALISRLVDASPGAAIPAALVSWENIDFSPTVGTRWYRATFLPGIPAATVLGDGSPNRHIGVFQIDIYDPKDSGDMLTQTEAERIIACFKRSTVLVYSGVTVRCTRAYRLPGNQEDTWYVMTVVVEYFADVTN